MGCPPTGALVNANSVSLAVAELYKPLESLTMPGRAGPRSRPNQNKVKIIPDWSVRPEPEQSRAYCAEYIDIAQRIPTSNLDLQSDREIPGDWQDLHLQTNV